MSDVVWPEEVTLPETIGEGLYRYEDGSPCCAVGYAAQAFGRPASVISHLEWERAFVICANCLVRRKEWSIGDAEQANDELSPKGRVLVYAAAWAYCGYSIHGFPEAARLAAKAKRQQEKN